MTNVSRINGKQKLILGNFMTAHPDLAKNRLTNCPQARATSKMLWDDLTLKLNSSGPPCKNCNAWKKVFSDQKHAVKKKLSFNKSSLKRTGGGPYEEKCLTTVDEQILEAAGLTAAVEGLKDVERFGSGIAINANVDELNVSENNEDNVKEIVVPRDTPKRRINKGKVKINLLKENINQVKDWCTEISHKIDQIIELREKTVKVLEENNKKLDKIIALKERSLQLKEVEHKSNMATKNIDLQIKSLELESLHRNYV